MRITNTNAESQKHLPSQKVLEKHGKEKKRHYNQCILKIEHGTFTPLGFSVNGSLGECSKFHKHVAEMIVHNKTEERYERIISIIRCKIFFLIIRSSLMCIRGRRSFDSKSPTNVYDFEIVCDIARCKT